MGVEDLKQCLESKVITDEPGVENFVATSVQVEPSNVAHSMVSIAPFSNSAQRHISKRLRFDGKQFANFVYFALAAAAMYDFLSVWRVPLLAPVVAIFALLGFVGCIFSLKITHHFEPEEALSASTRRMLRVGALVVPIPFLVFGAMDLAARVELQAGDHAYYDKHNYADGVVHYGNAARLSPNLAEPYEGLGACYYQLTDADKTLENADKALALDPEASYSWADKGWAEITLHPKALDGMKSAERAIELDDTNGQGYSVLSEALSNNGDYEKALAAADNHVKFHSNESEAFTGRSQILEKLGRFEEAAADAEKARALKNADRLSEAAANGTASNLVTK